MVLSENLLLYLFILMPKFFLIWPVGTIHWFLCPFDMRALFSLFGSCQVVLFHGCPLPFLGHYTLFPPPMFLSQICLFNKNSVYFIDYAVTFVPIFPLPLSAWYPLPSSSLPTQFMSMGWHVSSLPSPFPILFLTSLCLFCSYLLCFLIPTLFSPSFPFPLPAYNLPNDPHTYDSVLVFGCLLSLFLFLFFRFSC